MSKKLPLPSSLSTSLVVMIGLTGCGVKATNLSIFEDEGETSAVSSATITGQNNPPNIPTSLSCTTSPLGGETAQSCTLTAASTLDTDGDAVTYADGGSTCASASVNSSTGDATFTAPAKNATCLMKVKAYDNVAYSSIVSSATITGANNAPNAPSLSCPTTPVRNSTGNACTLTPASTLDVDSEAITYMDGGSTCSAFSIDPSTGATTFTAPATTATCLMKIKTYDGTDYSSIASSATITGTAVAPNAATSLTWTQTSPYSGTAVTASWTVSNSGDLSNQKIQFYTGSTCDTVSGSLIDLSSNSTSTRAFTGVNGTTYTYRITSIGAEADTLSACSGAMTIDTSAPTAPTFSSTNPASPNASTTPNVIGTSSTDTATLKIYGNSNCTTEIGSGTKAQFEGAGIAATALGLGGDLNYFYARAFDQAGNQSSCTFFTPYVTGSCFAETTKLGVGGSHACAILNGAAKCWGTNTYGQLGDQSDTTRIYPTLVFGLGQQVTSLGAGLHHTCAVVNGAAQCWGRNLGQLGDNTATTRYTPVPVNGLNSNVSQLSAGTKHTCAVVNGAAQCWGDNFYGQLGSNVAGPKLTPHPVSGLASNVSQIVSGSNHSCALTTNGAVQCWGANAYGQLGNDATTDRITPVQVTVLGTNVTQITAGNQHACAILTGGNVYCWGRNEYGQVGSTPYSPYLYQKAPVQVSGLPSSVTQITAGATMTCSIVSGSTRCWGNTSSVKNTLLPKLEGTATKLGFTVEPPSSTQSLGVAFTTQPTVAIQDACNNTVSSATNSVEITPATAAGCGSAATGSITATANPMNAVAGLAAFTNASYNYGSSNTIYIKGSSSGLTEACSSSSMLVQ